MERKTAELFSMSYMKTADIRNVRRLIIALLTDTDKKI